MSRARTVVVDIEGTASPLDAVHTTLFGHARRFYAGWVRAHADAPELSALRREAGATDDADAVGLLHALTDADVKSPALKDVQGRIWHDGFVHGTLRATVYPDVAPALRRWQQDGIDIAIYSSGSVLAQRDWFGHTNDGDLRPLIRSYFDLVSAGPKRDPSSYRAIAAQLGRLPGSIVFLTDVPAELDAAADAGWSVVGIHRDGPPPPHTPHRWAADFAGVPLESGAPAHVH